MYTHTYMLYVVCTYTCTLMYNVYVVLILWEEMHFIYFSRFQCFDKDGRSHTHGI